MDRSKSCLFGGVGVWWKIISGFGALATSCKWQSAPRSLIRFPSPLNCATFVELNVCSYRFPCSFSLPVEHNKVKNIGSALWKDANSFRQSSFGSTESIDELFQQQ
jgi:hypothetical protein